MKQHIAIAATAFFLSTAPALSGEAEIRAAQSSIEAQIRAFLAGENETAYSYAAPSIRRIFPTVEQFMAMVKNGYQPVWKPRDFAFGDAKEMSPTSIIQKVLVTGPDGKNYEAVYTLEMQDDGTFRITGVSLRGARTLGAQSRVQPMANRLRIATVTPATIAPTAVPQPVSTRATTGS